MSSSIPFFAIGFIAYGCDWKKSYFYGIFHSENPFRYTSTVTDVLLIINTHKPGGQTTWDDGGNGLHAC